MTRQSLRNGGVIGNRKITTISTKAFETQAKHAIDLQPLRKEIVLSQISVDDEGTLVYHDADHGDMRIGIQSRAFQDFIEMIKFPKAFAHRIENMFDKKTKIDLMNTIKSQMASQKNLNLLMTLNPKDSTVLRVMPANKMFISNESFIDFSKSIIDRKGLDIVSFDINPHDGGMTINTMNRKNEVMIKGVKDEAFWTGLSFTNDPNGGTLVSPYLMRLICANGNMSTAFDETYRLKSLDAAVVRTFNEKLSYLESKNFFPEKFEGAVLKASNTKASLMEIQHAVTQLKVIAKLNDDQINEWIPAREIKQAYSNMGMELEKMTNHMKQNGRTPVSVWDLTNVLTEIGSHGKSEFKYNIDEYGGVALQVAASNLLAKKKYDTENLLANQPF